MAMAIRLKPDNKKGEGVLTLTVIFAIGKFKKNGYRQDATKGLMVAQHIYKYGEWRFDLLFCGLVRSRGPHKSTMPSRIASGAPPDRSKENACR